MVGSSSSSSIVRRSFPGCHTSSWSASATTAPVALPSARSKLRVGPSRTSLTSTDTAKGAVRSKERSRSSVPSLEPSSPTMSSSGSRVCAASEASIGGSQRAPS